MSRTLVDDTGAVCLTAFPFVVGDRERGVQLRWLDSASSLPSPDALFEAFSSIVTDARAEHVRLIETRVVTRDVDRDETIIAARASMTRSALTSLGFARDGGRDEFRLALDGDELSAWLAPLAARDPFHWSALPPSGELTFERAARAMHEVSVGDPSSSPDEDAAAALREYLADGSFTNDPLGVQVGTLDGVDAAFVMTQANPATGWSRITYMGLAPTHRTRGLGAVVHARGVSLARTLGARVYVGGTSTDNAPMLALFRRLGAAPFRAMERWVLSIESTAA